MAARIAEGWGPVLRVIELIPGSGGIFDVVVNGDLIFNKQMLGRFPEPEHVLALLRARIGDEVV